MHSWEALPSVPFRPAAGPLTTAVMARGLTDFRAAGHYLQRLPYGRTTTRADFTAVLRQGKGTCSTKHALLAALAQEQELVAMVLTLGIYEMHERNTPGVGPVLERHGLACLPEAHCYLTYEGKRIDITRAGTDPAEPIVRFLHEEAITPAQIGDYKVALHRQFLRAWTTSNERAIGGRNFEEIWRLREACITALAQGSDARA
jgi:hypothetical protein